MAGSASDKKKGAVYIRKTLVSNERVLYVGKLHNFAYIPPAVMVFIGLFLCFLPVILQQDVHVEAGATGERVAEMKDRASSKIHELREHIPDEVLPYLDKANNARRLVLGMLLLGFGVMRLINTVIKKKTMEHAITNKKVIKKRGMISVDTSELNLDRIESVKISQTAFDRIINRGRVLVTGIGMEQIDMRRMYNPAELKKAILETIDLFVNKAR